ncbi:PqiC family protein [Jeongeupia naejangsanensis]|uniref:Membrane integrity-associated transporter subunit PqiC n=1 Tax=Jeongeupia naejangsanensis TaxID=613195 RepID=A0ABS2BNG5_9NEIS|nr:PqiC family protein [Jeongeupia naejangsanensis]MBM3116980.1 membrane integrity-associated transporter subunit PqiC [Jeongeupia naejangsanensis]
MTRFTRTLFATGITALVVAGCASAPKEYFYSLGSTALTDAPAVGGNTSVPVAISAVTLPEAVDRPQLVVQQSGELRIQDQRRWIQPLRSDLAAAVADQLGRQLGTQVATPNQAAGAEAQYRLAIDIQRFDSVLGGSATLDALWRVSDASGKPVKSGRFSASEAAKDGGYDSLIAAHGRLVAKLSQQIGTQLKPLMAAPAK